jgi:hypothetical protein
MSAGTVPHCPSGEEPKEKKIKSGQVRFSGFWGKSLERLEDKLSGHGQPRNCKFCGKLAHLVIPQGEVDVTK